MDMHDLSVLNLEKMDRPRNENPLASGWHTAHKQGSYHWRGQSPVGNLRNDGVLPGQQLYNEKLALFMIRFTALSVSASFRATLCGMALSLHE